MKNFSVEKINKSDREDIRRICCETGYAGEDIKPYVDDLNLFADIWTLYYTDLEPDSGFVAKVEGETVGYLTGSLNTKSFNRIFASKIIPGILFRSALRKYRLGKKTAKYFLNMMRQLKRGNIYPPLDKYPAHLHINIEEGYRRRGLGEALLEKYLDYLKGKNVNGVHLGTTSLNTSAVPFYEKLGFELYSSIPNTSFKGRKARSLIYVKQLADE